MTTTSLVHAIALWTAWWGFPEVRLTPLLAPHPVALRAYAVARHGRLAWPPLSLVTDLLCRRSATTNPGNPAPLS